MATIHAKLKDRPDFDRLPQDNALVRDELRRQLQNDRKTDRKTQVFELEDVHEAHRRNLKANTGSPAEGKTQLLDGFQGRSESRNFGGRLERELRKIRETFESIHRDLLASKLMSNLNGKKVANQDDVDTLKRNFKRILTELMSLNSMLAKSGGCNVLLSNGLEGPKTKSSPTSAGCTTSKNTDLVHLAGPVTENALLSVLEDRLSSGHTMTKLGPVLMCLNPFVSACNQDSTDMIHLEPVVKQSIYKLGEREIPQVFVLSGCSGSGKTYLSQVLTRSILEEGDCGLESDISKHFLASITVLHALGMAKMLSNTNSSRVGHLYEFHFNGRNISKTKIHLYQLDTTRVVSPGIGERNYHVFYQMLAGVTQDERAKLHLQGYSFYNLNYLSKCPLPSEDEENHFKAKFEKWRAGLMTLGIPFPDVLRILAAILLLGNIQFVEGEGLELDVKGNNEIKAVAALLGVSGVSLYRGLTTKTKNLRGQVFRSLCEPAMANVYRDTLAMALYSRTLAAIARRVNSFKRPTSSTVTGNSPQEVGESSSGSPSRKTAMPQGFTTSPQGSPVHSPIWSSSQSLPSMTKGATGVVSVMDMFGFENTKVNQLQQMCLNLCSETLQHFYNTHVFKSSEEYCRGEDLVNDFDIDYIDNASCIELMTCQRAGIFTLLDAETLHARGTHQSLLEKLRAEHQNKPCFYIPDPNSSCFTVSHHASNVVYETQDLLEINRDTIPDDIICIFSRQNCNFGFASHLFTSDLKSAQGQTAAPKGQSHRIAPPSGQDTNGVSGGYDNTQTTFSQDFQSKLDHLLKTLVQAEPTFLRCIKANQQEKPNVFDRKVVSQQLRTLQVFETLQLLQSEVAHHCRLEVFIQKYGILSRRSLSGLEEMLPQDCTSILDSVSETPSWIIGSKYVFFSEVIKQELDGQLGERRLLAAVRIQAGVRGWLYRKQWKNLKRSLEMQRKARQQSRSNQKHGSNRHIATSHHELSVDTKSAEKMCCLYGLDMETPPPLPKSRPYTVMGNMKMGYPQTRVMKQDLQDGDGQVLLRKGEHVKIVGAARKRGYLLVEHSSGTNIQVPFQITELKVSPRSSPR